MRRAVWEPGDAIVWTMHLDGNLWGQRRMSVVEDRGDAVLAWIAPGSSQLLKVRPPAAPDDDSWIVPLRASGDWELSEQTWYGGGALLYAMDGVAHAIFALFDEDGAMRQWYINVQDEPAWDERGFDSMDHLLDVEIAPDLSSWNLKDEHHLSEAVRLGLYSAERAREIRDEAARGVQRLLADGPPFDAIVPG